MKKIIKYSWYVVIILLVVFNGKINELMIKTDNNIDKDIIFSNYYSYMYNDYNELLNDNGLKINNDIKLIHTKIKYRNIYEFLDEITIYKGKNDGINIGNAVINKNGLIGTIKEVYDNSSIVKLITNIDSNISVKINKSYGILKIIDNTLVVCNLSNYDDIKLSDKIYTSGIGNLPGGLYIGKVGEITENLSKIEQIVKVDTNNNLKELNYLYVVGDVND